MTLLPIKKTVVVYPGIASEGEVNQINSDESLNLSQPTIASDFTKTLKFNSTGRPLRIKAQIQSFCSTLTAPTSGTAVNTACWGSYELTRVNDNTLIGTSSFKGTYNMIGATPDLSLGTYRFESQDTFFDVIDRNPPVGVVTYKITVNTSFATSNAAKDALGSFILRYRGTTLEEAYT